MLRQFQKLLGCLFVFAQLVKLYVKLLKFFFIFVRLIFKRLYGINSSKKILSYFLQFLYPLVYALAIKQLVWGNFIRDTEQSNTDSSISQQFFFDVHVESTLP
uniref:Uncharacterized protein n=1 Tax=Candidatus Kentrum sp. DK TaxID=2126562 RepID=A0A450SU67_9GAMM|nr:MAG: hypothetical protein BECKDK2373C_GA0170839_106015 [Candidatus Kentron sp. DK]